MDAASVILNAFSHLYSCQNVRNPKLMSADNNYFCAKITQEELLFIQSGFPGELNHMTSYLDDEHSLPP